ncbi:Ser/Thr protein kinase RdoA (MazF antagonist), partial [Marisediminicola sp. UYEF4]|uniref:phosphotransferase n=1 Tax=Marisediminicola sp. UYEF4 TaxID=1756384 RepID=UPI00339B99D6
RLDDQQKRRPGTIIPDAASPCPLDKSNYISAESGQDSIHPRWVRDAVARVYSEYTKLPPLTWALLHTDPEPEAFLRDDSGNVGVIDWAGSVPGPALYDLASAVMYAGGERHAQPLLDAYERVGVVTGTEIRTHLGSLRRLRAGVQAEYFSRRLHLADLTGVDSIDDNEQGLRDAQEMLQLLGVQVS